MTISLSLSRSLPSFLPPSSPSSLALYPTSLLPSLYSFTHSSHSSTQACFSFHFLSFPPPPIIRIQPLSWAWSLCLFMVSLHGLIYYSVSYGVMPVYLNQHFLLLHGLALLLVLLSLESPFTSTTQCSTELLNEFYVPNSLHCNRCTIDMSHIRIELDFIKFQRLNIRGWDRHCCVLWCNAGIQYI